MAYSRNEQALAIADPRVAPLKANVVGEVGQYHETGRLAARCVDSSRSLEETMLIPGMKQQVALIVRRGDEPNVPRL